MSLASLQSTLKRRLFQRGNALPRPGKLWERFIPRFIELEDRCMLSYVPLLPDAGTVQNQNLNAVLYTPEGDASFNQANLPSAKLVTLMNTSNNLVFPIFYGANSTADLTAGQVVRLELLTPGSGYGSGPVTVSITGGSGTGAAGKVQANGSLFGLELLSGGSGYQPGDQLTVTFGGTGTGATAKAYVSQFDSTHALYDPKDALNKTHRGYVGEVDPVTGKYRLGLQPGHQVTIQVPMAFWDGGRLYFATNGSVPLTSNFDPGFPLQNNSEWLYNTSTDPNVIQSYIVAPSHPGHQPLYGANFADPVTGVANQSGVVMWYRDLSAPHDFGFGVPAVLTEMSIRDPKQFHIAPDMPPSEIDTIINYDVSYVDSLALPASMQGSMVPTRPLATPGPQQFTWLGSDMSSEQMQQLIAYFTTNDLTGGTAGVSGANGLGKYFGGLGYDQYYMPPDNSPSGAITAINNPSSGAVTIFTANTGALVNGMTVVISGVTGQTALNAAWVVSSVTPTSFVLTGITGDGTASSGGAFAAQTTGVHIQKLPAGFQVIADSQNQNVQSSFDATRYNLVSGGVKANISTIGTGVSTMGSKNITGVSYDTAKLMVAGMLWSPVNAANSKPYFPNGSRIESITLGTVGGTDSIIVMTQAANESGSPGGTGGGTGPGGSWTFNGSQFTSAQGTIAASTNQIINLDPAVGIYLRPGMLVTGEHIPAGTFIQTISANFQTITLTQSIGATPSAGPYTFLGSPDSYVVQKLINVWYAWADYYVKELAAAPSGSFAGTTTANGGRTDYNSLILKVTNGAFDMTQLRVGNVVTSAGSSLTPNLTPSDPSQNYTIISINEHERTVELSLPVAVTAAQADTFNFSPPQHIVRSSDAPAAAGTAGTIPYTLDFAGATQAEKDNALLFARSIYKVMQSFSLLLDPQTLLSRSALLLRYSIGGNVGSFVTNDGFFPETGRHTILPHQRTHVELRDEIKSILRGVYDFQKVPDQSLWYPDPAVQTPNATLDQGSGAQPVDFGIYNISPYVWFVHTVLHNSSYGFSLDDDVANTTANSNSIQIAFGGNAYTAPTDTNDPPAPFLKNPEAYTGGAQYGTQQSQGFIDVTSSYALSNKQHGMTTISGLSQVAVARLKASTDPSDPPGALITSDVAGLLPPGVRISLVTVLAPVGGMDNQSWVTFKTPEGWTAPTNQAQHLFTFSGFETRVPDNVAPSVAQAPPGTIITITGKNLTGVYGVSFNGIPGIIVGGGISSITNPNAGTVTIHTANTQGLVNGDHVTISGVIGQTALNGTWVVGNVTANTFDLTGIMGNGVASSVGNWIAGTDSAFKAIVPNFIPNHDGTTYPGPTGRIGVRNASGTDYSATFFTIGSTGAPTFTGIGQVGSATANGSLGSTVTLFGTGFNGTTAVTFDGGAGIPITQFSVAGAGSQLQITIPVGATGTGTFTITVGGTPHTSTGYTFTVNQPVIAPVTPFSPATGPVGTIVTITGTGFTGADDPHTGGVTINGVAATNVQVINDTTISVQVAAGTTTGQVVVTTSAGSGNSGANDFTVTAHLTPTITSASVGSAPVGAVIQLVGTNFTGTTGITFGGIAATTFQVVDDQNINVTVPIGAPIGSAPIEVTSPGGTSSPFAFTVTAATAPVITQFSPGSGDENTEVTLTGSGFTNVHQVEFNQTSANFTIVNDTTIITYVPAGATTGLITVTNGAGTGTSATSFVVGTQPTITSFSPGSGPVGQVVTLTGTGFSKVTGVSFNGMAASSFSVISDQSMTATVPDGATTGRITVSTSDGHSGASATDFTVTFELAFVAAPKNGLPLRGFDAAGKQLFMFVPFAGYNGNVSVAVGDVNADTVPDLIVSTIGSPARVKVFNGTTLATTPVELISFQAFGNAGAFVAVGDINADNHADIILGDAGNGGRLRAYNGLDAGNGNAVILANTTVFPSGAVRVAVGDFNADSTPDVIVAQAADSGIKVFNGAALAAGNKNKIGDVNGFANGSFVSAGDFNNDSRADVVVGRDSGASRIKVFNAANTNQVLLNFEAVPGANQGVRVAVTDLNGDTVADIVAALAGGNPEVLGFNGVNGQEILDINALTNYTNGLFVAGNGHFGSPLHLQAGLGAGAATLTNGQLAPVVAEAIQIFADAGLSSVLIGKLLAVNVYIVDLGGTTLGVAYANAIKIDSDAAGHGWSLDDSVGHDEVDLLSVLVHEFGHVLGLDHDAAAFMDDQIGLGERRIPTAHDLDALFAGGDW